MQVYEKVRNYIEDKGLKQIVIAEASGIPNVTFNAMLNGRRKMYAEDLKAICIALDVSADIFMSSDEKAS